jgi:hypothetical protein
MENEGLPVVYSILNADDSLQQVRLAKSFFPQKGYTDLEHLAIERWNEHVDIYIEEWKDAERPVIYTFHEADTVRQDTGYFTNPSFRLYQSAFRPLPGVRYYLYLWFPQRNVYTYASTTVISHPEILTPAAIPGRKITFSDVDDFIVELRLPFNSGFHQFGFILTVEENRSDNIDIDYFDFGGQSYEANNGQILLYLLNSARFYDGLTNRYDTLGGTDYRRIAGLEFVTWSYGEEMRIYNQLYNSGTQPWETQSYSSFVNAFGLFTSKAHSRLTNLELSDLTYRLLTQDPRYTFMKFTR